MKFDLEGKCALVTGAARGIGHAIATMLAASGARVAFTDIDLDAVQRVAAEVPRALALEMDVSDEQQVTSVIGEIIEQFQHLDILINNAGVNTIQHRVNIDQFPTEEWERIVDVDLKGTYLVSRTAARAMISKRSGRIVNIASVLGVVPARRQCAFIAAKGGVVQLTRAMAIELAEHEILVNCVAPGSTLTDGTRDLFYGESGVEKDRARELLRHIPLGRPGTVEEMANAVLFFATPENTYITGQTLCVDGGWAAGGFLRDF